MNTIANQNTGINTLTFVERVLRVTVGSAFIGSIFTATATVLDWQVVLPLLGSYAVVSGMTGTGILRSFLDSRPALYRGVQIALSVGLISTVFIDNTAPLGLIAILPIIGIYAAFAALLGQSPVNAVIEATKVVPYIVAPPGELTETSARSARRNNVATLSHVA
jgi:hypothetical protein